MEDKIKQTMRKVQMVDIAKLHPYENNPRNNEKAVPKIAESIKRYGFNVPITADRNGVIATGHTRYKAALSLGLREVPVIYLDDLDESEIAAWRLVDNKTGEIATWEEDKLNLELKALLGLKVDLSDFGFPGEDKMLEQVREDDFMPVLPKEPRSRRGDVVLDQFGGSGSTLIACEETGRRCRMMELDPAYVDVIVDRYQKFTGRKAIKQGGDI